MIENCLIRLSLKFLIIIELNQSSEFSQSDNSFKISNAYNHTTMLIALADQQTAPVLAQKACAIPGPTCILPNIYLSSVNQCWNNWKGWHLCLHHYSASTASQFCIWGIRQAIIQFTLHFQWNHPLYNLADGSQQIYSCSSSDTDSEDFDLSSSMHSFMSASLQIMKSCAHKAFSNDSYLRPEIVRC